MNPTMHSQIPRKLVSLIASTKRSNNLPNILANAARQVYRPLELILVLHGLKTTPEKIKDQALKTGIHRIQIVAAAAEKTLGHCLNAGVEAASGKYLAKFDDDDLYTPAYISDSINALETTHAEIVGKGTFYVYLREKKLLLVYRSGRECKKVKQVAGPTMVMKKSLAAHIRFPDITIGEDKEFQKECKRQGGTIYSTDRYNFALVRHAPSAHTWQATQERFLIKGTEHQFAEDINDVLQLIERD